MEVLATVTLMATILTAIFGLQGSLFRLISRRHNVMERVFVLRSMFLDHQKIDKFKEEPFTGKIIEEKILDPRMEVVLESEGISSSSYPFLYKVKSVGTWQGMYRQEEDDVLGLMFAYVPPDRPAEEKMGRGK